ncbi:MAG: enoyl-CoA hydratase-related protein [Pseudomonadota bacterium]
MTVKYENPTERVALITLNRPDQLNAFNADMRADLLQAVRRASADDAVRAVVVTGEGRGFCAGADVSASMEDDSVEDILNTEYGAFLGVVQTMPKPVIAAVTGPAAGIGMTLALTCDLCVIGEGAYLMPAFANIGLVPDGGLSLLLTQQLGYARAFQIAIEAEKVDAARALEWGLVNRVEPSEAVKDTALNWAAEIAERAPVAMALTKRTFRSAAQSGLREAASFEAAAQRAAFQTDDFREGVTALFQKRKPNFQGK